MLRLSLLVLLATSASAQVAPLDGRGVFVGLGASTPERLLFPTNADPTVMIGARLSPSIEVQAGLARGTHTLVEDIPSQDRRLEWISRTRGFAISAALADRLGRTVVRGRVSLGYDMLQFKAVEMDNLSGPGASGTSTFRAIRAEYLHTAVGAEAGLPIAVGPALAVPSAGLAGAVSALTTGTQDAPSARLLPYVRLPLSLRLPGVALTLETTVGVAFGRQDAPYDPELRRSPASPSGTPVTETALRIDF